MIDTSIDAPYGRKPFEQVVEECRLPHRLSLDASALPAGVYVVRAAVGEGRIFTQRLTVIR